MTRRRRQAPDDPATLDDGSLARHLVDVHDHLRWTTRRHFRLHVSDMGPLGNLIVHLEDWRLPDGTKIDVDPVAGRVTVLGGRLRGIRSPFLVAQPRSARLRDRNRRADGC